jgi:hypothetical protein
MMQTDSVKPKINVLSQFLGKTANTMSAEDLAAKTIQMAIETTSNAISVEQENQKMREQLKKNLDVLGDFDAATPRAQGLQAQLREKQAELEEKRKSLVEIQGAVIRAIKQQEQGGGNTAQEQLEVVPIIMNRIQKFVSDLSDAAVEQKSIAIPILSVFEVVQSLNKLYDALLDKEIIKESPEAKEERVRRLVSAQQEILVKLQAIMEAGDPDEGEETEATAPAEPPGPE